MKKILSLLCLMMLAMTSAWADDVSVTWSMADGASSTGVANPSSSATEIEWSMGSNIVVDATATGTYFEKTFTRFTNTKKLDNNRNKIDDNYIEFKFKPLGGSFTPTQVSFDITKIGTGDPKIWVEFIDGANNTKKLGEGVVIRKNSEDTPSESQSFEVSGAAASENAVALRIYIGKLATNKQVGLANVVIEGTLVSADAPVLSATKDVNLKVTPLTPELTATATIALSGKNLSDGTYNAPIPDDGAITITPATFTVTDGVVNQDFVVTFKPTVTVTDGVTNLIFTVNDLSASTTIKYNARLEAYEQTIVSAAASWDWTTLTATVELTNETVPSINDEFVFKELEDQINFGSFDAQSIVISKTQFPSRNKKFQNGTIKFKTAVPGVITVDFSDTGSSGDNPVKRYLYVNGRQTEYYTQRNGSSDRKVSGEIVVPAGEVSICGWDPTAEIKDEDENVIGIGANVPLCIYKVTFEPKAMPTKTIGLIPGVWAADNATFAAYAYNSNTDNAWFPFVEASGAFVTQIPDYYDNIVLARLKPATDGEFNSENNGLNWANKWNQTADIDFTTVADNTIFNITGWGGEKSPYSAIDIAGAIEQATALNAYANDADLATAIGNAETAVAGDDITAIKDAATALEAAAKTAANNTLKNAVTLAETFGVEVADEVKALVDNDTATAEQLATALTALFNNAQTAVASALADAKAFANNYGYGNVADAIDEVSAAVVAKNIDQINAKINALKTVAVPAAIEAIGKLEGYAEDLDNEALNTAIATAKGSLSGGNIKTIIENLKAIEGPFKAAALAYANKVKDVEDATVQEKLAALTAAVNAENPSILAIGDAVKELVQAYRAYEESIAVYTVVGGFTIEGGIDNVLFGKQWEPTLTANDMVKGADGIWTKTYEHVALEAGTTIFYKVVKNHSWDETWGFEKDGNNADYNVQATGTYKVTFKFVPKGVLEDNNLSVTCVLVPEVTLNEEGENTETLAAWNGKKADVTLTRTLKAGSWNTFCVPFNVDQATCESMGITAVKELASSSLEGNTLTLSFANVGGLGAGRCYLVKVNADVENPKFYGVEIFNFTQASETGYVNFIPTLGKTTITGEDASTVLFLAAENKLKNPETLPTDMKGFRGYFLLHDANAARNFVLDLGDGETTGITTLNVERGTLNGEIFDLQGRRVNSAAQKGVYIVNGKKTVIK